MKHSDSVLAYTLTIPSVTAFPSTRCLQWTHDGQVCLTTKNAVYILTPAHGINFDTDSVIRSALGKDTARLAWFRTMIETEKVPTTKWSEYSQSWAAMSLGSLDDAVVSVAISPTNLAPNGGCVIATLSANMDVVLWIAGGNYLKGKWAKVFEITPFILDRVSSEAHDNPSLPSVLQAQITSIEWTPQVDFGTSAMPRLDSSLLILGSRAGYVTLLRFRDDCSVEYLQTLSVSEQWITRLAFDSWRTIAPGSYEGKFVYGASDGSVGLVKIVQNLRPRDVPAFTPRYDLDVGLEYNGQLIYKADDNAGMTSLKWVPIPGRTATLVSSTPGVLKLFSESFGPSTTSWTGYRKIRLKTQKTSRNSSALHPVSGIHYLSGSNALIVTLFDGSFHVVQNLSDEPNIVESSSTVGTSLDFKECLTSEALSRMARSTFGRAEKGNVNKNDMNRIHGAVAYDGDATFMWAYESSRPSDFSYKQDSQGNSTVVVAQLWNSGDDNHLLEKLALVLSSAKACWGLSPLHMLRPFLLHFEDPKRLSECHDQLLDVIRPVLEDDFSKHITIHSWGAGHVTDQLRESFRYSLSTHLFGWDELLSLRMRLSLADFAWKLSGNDEVQAKCGAAAQIILNSISHRITRIIIRHLVAVIEMLTPNELPFASRMVVQCIHDGTPDLSEEGNQLFMLLQPLVDSIGPFGNPSVPPVGNLDEKCPACGVVVPLEGITSARCMNGHSWPRCSVTTFILSTPWVRTCVGCCRKAFLPPSALSQTNGQELPLVARGWVVEELLESVRKCLFCGNGFVQIL